MLNLRFWDLAATTLESGLGAKGDIWNIGLIGRTNIALKNVSIGIVTTTTYFTQS
jgi:hypothetical protein